MQNSSSENFEAEYAILTNVLEVWLVVLASTAGEPWCSLTRV